MFIIKKNAIRCKKCGDIIESTSTHDFKFCSCGACAVDGGHEYCRRLGNRDDWESVSEVVEVEDPPAIKKMREEWKNLPRRPERKKW